MAEKKLIPELRFPEFDGEWEDDVIRNLFRIKNGYAFSSNDTRERGVRWIKITDVGLNKIENHILSYLPDNYSTSFSEYLLLEGDYVIALTRPILRGKLKIAKINNSVNKSLLNQRWENYIT